MIQFKEYDRCPDKRYYIEFLVLKNISRVLKNHKMFANFRCSIGYHNRGKMSFPYRLTHVMDNTVSALLVHNPFTHCETIEDVVKIMSGGHEFNNYDDDARVQKKVIDCINMLLHVLVERTIKGNFSILEEIGGETFKITCQELFGNDFVDHTIPEGVDMNIIRKISEMSRRGELPELTPEIKKQMELFMNHVRSLSPEEEFIGEEEDERWDDVEEEEFDGDWQ